MSTKTCEVLRWVAVLPASLIAALVAWFVVTLGNGIFNGPQSDGICSLLWRGCIEFFASMVMGATFVYAGAYVAPSHKKCVSYVLAGVGLLVIGFLLFPAFLVQNYWAVWSDCSAIVGIASVTYNIYTENFVSGSD